MVETRQKRFDVSTRDEEANDAMEAGHDKYVSFSATEENLLL